MPFLRCLGCGTLVRTTADSCPRCSFPLRIPASSSALVTGPGDGLRCADCGARVDAAGACPSCGAGLTGASPPARA
jgi:primosomal protein N'